MASLLEETKNCNSDDEKQKSEEKEVEDQPTHEFSSPWDDSDLVLIVENQKLHVHSFLLKMASPVFKAMLSGDFKEKNARELVLPGKKADQFVDFLRQFYPQFDFPISLENIEHIYALADEYQTKTVITSCIKVLEHVKVTRDNVSRMIDLAQKMGCNEVRQNCYKILNEMTVHELTSSKGFMAMDKESLHQVLVPKAKRLEKCLREIQPQFVGVLDFLLYVWGHKDNKCKMRGKPTKCPAHTYSQSSEVTASITKRLKCSACVQILELMADNSLDKYGDQFYNNEGMHFDEDIVKVLQEMVDILKTK